MNSADKCNDWIDNNYHDLIQKFAERYSSKFYDFAVEEYQNQLTEIEYVLEEAQK